MKPCYSEPFLAFYMIICTFTCELTRQIEISSGQMVSKTTPPTCHLQLSMWWEVACSASAVFTIGRMCKPLPQLCMY